MVDFEDESFEDEEPDLQSHDYKREDDDTDEFERKSYELDVLNSIGIL